MSLDIYLKKKYYRTLDKVEFEECYDTVVNGLNITHNLGEMADKAGLYEALWRPHRLKSDYNIPEDDNCAEDEFEENDTTYAKDLIRHLENGLCELKKYPDKYKEFNPVNGWGDYDGLVRFTEKYLKACLENPDTIVEVSR